MLHNVQGVCIKHIEAQPMVHNVHCKPKM
jgi:hypothetical protein